MFALYLYLFVNLFIVGLSVCPAGWAQYENRCFYIFDDTLNRSAAESLCEAHSATLVTFANLNEWDYISSLIKSVQLKSGAWTELIYNNSIWQWADTTPYTELHRWNSSGAGGSLDVDNVLVPSPSYYQAKITIVGTETYMMVDLSSTALHPFCVRSLDSRDLCDTNEDWIFLLHGCHKLYPPATWSDAITTCSNLGGELFSPNSAEELLPAVTLTSSNTSIWIGASYKNSGYYFEADHRPVDFLPWLQAGSNYSDANRTCLAGLNINGHVGYYMTYCTLEITFTCKKPVGTCPLGWYQDGLKCFRLHIRPEERMTWIMAVDYCRSQNAVIAQEILGVEANTMLYNVLNENDVHLAWLGISGSGWPYKDVSGNNILGNVYAFDTTNIQGGPASCGVTDFDPRRTELFMTSYCFTPQPFVCTIPLADNLSPVGTPTAGCDTGWILFKDQCYKVIMTPMTYDKAVSNCQSLGGNIFQVNSTIQQSFFSTPVFMSYGLEYYWIGVKYDVSSSQYVFPDTNKEVNFWNFDPNQQYNSSYAPCVSVGTGSNPPFIGSWFAELCNVMHNFVCQLPAQPVTQQPSVIQTLWSSQCGIGWMYSNTTNLCYFISPYVHKPWREVRADCQARHGELLSIGGEVEQRTIESILKSDLYSTLEESLWIGAADMTEWNGWSWSDNRPFRYLHWAEGEPQYDSDDGDNCGYIPVTKVFEWEARSCGDKLGFICRKAASQVQAPDQPPSPTYSSSCDPQPLISGYHSIQFPQDFSASSSLDAQHTPDHSRMIPFNSVSWSPANDSLGQWMAVTFHSPLTITEIQLGGEDATDKYVSKFKLQYQYDATSPWYWITETNKSVRIFDGVTAPGSSTSIYLFGEIQAHALKIWPVEWSFGIAIQLELTGCAEDECVSEYAMSGPLFVDDRNIRASSELPGHEAWNARLKPAKFRQQLTAWMPMVTDQKPWIEVDLGKKRIVQGITVAGDDLGNYVASFQLLLSRTPGGEFITYAEPYGQPHTFSTLTGIQQPVTVYLEVSLEARIVRIVPQTWQKQIALKFDVLVCSSGCTADPMIANLPSSQLTASNSQSDYTPSRSKLNTKRVGDEPSYWKPLPGNLVDASFIQADLGIVMQVKSVATQGSVSDGAWVTSYNLAFSTDGQTFRRYGGNVTFYTIANAVTVYNDSVIYPGNFDDATVVKNELAQPVNARYVQLWPHSFHNSIALRWEIYACSKHTASTPLGCYADDPSDPDLPYVPLTDQYGSMWPEACLSYCYDKGYHYAGLQNGDLCSCGNFYGMYGVAQGCNMSCQDPYANFRCGGLNQNMVYSTGLSANTLICPSGWTAYKGSCYSFIGQDTWTNARDSCQNMGAHLVDISDKGENDMVANLVGDDSWREFVTVTIGKNAWIGFNDINANLNFEWSSRADVNFTNWGRHQPTVNPGLKQHAVMISPDGSWTNTYEDDVNFFVCETTMTPSSDSATNTQYIGCLPGWRAGDLKCYRFYRQRSSWSDATTFCASQNSSLARADTSKENIVLSSLLSGLDGSYWIDVHDGNSTGLYTHDTVKHDMSYTNWARQKPDSSGRCVSVKTAQHAGEWTNEACQNKNRFVCEQPRTGYFPAHVITPNVKGSCASGWELHGTLCYQFNIVEASSLLTWHEANENCIQQGATLASFHSDIDFNGVTAIFSKGMDNFWIGLNNLDSSTGFKWSDGSVMNFIRWDDGQPRVSQSLSDCGEILTDTQTMGLQLCTERRNWICSAHRGKPVTNATTDNIPTPENLGACKPLANNWYKYKDYCYYISTGDGKTDDSLTWRESRQWCQQRGADLASVNSGDENAFLRGMLNHGIPVVAAWIGLNELDRSSGYSWSDGTPVGSWLMNWNVNEPDDYNGFEGCVEMLARNGRWNDDHCSVRQGFVCKQPAPGVNVTKPIPVERYAGNCPPNFSRLGYKCYRVMGLNGDLDKQTWTDAQSSCHYMLYSTRSNYSIDLASITSQEENAFITLLLSQYKLSAWLGLKRLPSGQYVWTDNEDLGFEAWNKDEPNMAPGNDSCVYIYGDDNFVGTWNDVHCQEKMSYICQGYVDPAFPAVVAPPTSMCNVTDGYQVFGISCYKVYNHTISWQDAKASCALSHAYLATVMDGYDWSEMYLLSHAYSDGVWTGLNDLKSPGMYTWDSGYPVTYTRWAHHQPKDTTTGGCVYMDSSGLFNNSHCTDLRAYVCRRDLRSPAVIPQVVDGVCSKSDFILHGSACYLLILNPQLTYELAGTECELRGATLASIHNSSLIFQIPHGQSIWIGLRESAKEGFSWEDSSVLDYVRWAPNEPSWSGNDVTEKSCVAMYGDGSWANVDCGNKNGYLCGIPAISQDSHPTLPPISETQRIPTTPTTRTPVPNTQKTPPTSSTNAQSTTLTAITSQGQTSVTKGFSHSQTSVTKGFSQSQTSFTKGFSQSQTSSLPSSSEPLPSQQKDSGGLSSGDIAGVVVGVLVAVLIIIGIVFAIYRYGILKSSFLRREASKVKNFENSLYEETRKDTLTKSDHIDGINIMAMESDPRELSVSYSVFSASDDFNSEDVSNA